MALPIDDCAERSTSRTFFSTLFSMSEHSSITSDSSFSIFSNRVTAFGDFFFFGFMSQLPVQDRTKYRTSQEYSNSTCSGCVRSRRCLHQLHLCRSRPTRGAKFFCLRQNHRDALLS